MVWQASIKRSISSAGSSEKGATLARKAQESAGCMGLVSISVVHPGIVGFPGSRARLTQSMNPLFGKQRDELDQDFGGHHGVADGGMTTDDSQAEAFGDGFQAMRVLVFMHQGRQQQGIEHRVIKAHA